MRSFEAKDIIEDARKEGSCIEFLGEDDQEVKLEGTFTIEQLQAILHKMEYD